MKKILHYLDEYLEEFLMVIFLIAMTLIMGIQVFSRYILGMSLSWSEEITRYLFIWSAFLSFSLCTRKCISIKIDQFIQLFPRKYSQFYILLFVIIFKNGVTAHSLQMPRRHFILLHGFIQAFLTCSYEVIQVP